MSDNVPPKPTKFLSGIIAYQPVEDTKDSIQILHFCGFEKDDVTDEDIGELHVELMTDPAYGLTDGNYELARADEEILDMYNKMIEEDNITMVPTEILPEENE